jgi:micrococcal nuclease
LPLALERGIVRRGLLVSLLVVAFVLAGCAGTPRSTTGPAATADGTPALDRQPVTVLEVVDGDTIVVRLDGRQETVRLLGVDTPETNGETTPTEFPTVPDTAAGRAHLRHWGERADGFTRERLANATVTIATDPQADRRGGYGRLLAYVFADGTLLNRQLLDRGYARFYDAPLSRYEQFDGAAAQARAHRRGLWNVTATTRTPTANLTVAAIHPDAAGNDNENLNDEYVVLRNTADTPLAVGGWTVSDAAGHTLRFPPNTTIAAGERLTLYTGAGTPTATAVYWGADGAIWNNDGDTITVRDDTGALVVERRYE